MADKDTELQNVAADFERDFDAKFIEEEPEPPAPLVAITASTVKLGDGKLSIDGKAVGTVTDVTLTMPKTPAPAFKNMVPITPVASVLRPSPESYNYQADKPKGDEIGNGDQVDYLGYLYTVKSRSGDILTMNLLSNPTGSDYHALASRVKKVNE